MEHLKDYIIGRMLVDPSLDPDALIKSFLVGYYGSSHLQYAESVQKQPHYVLNGVLFCNPPHRDRCIQTGRQSRSHAATQPHSS